MKTAGPGQRVRHHPGIVAQDFARNPLNAFCHLGSGAARERHQKNAPGVGAADDQMGDAMGQCVGLAGSGAGDHQERRGWPLARRAMLDGAPLFRIKTFEIGGCRWHGLIVLRWKPNSVIPDAPTMASTPVQPSKKNRAKIDSWPKFMNKSRTMH